MHIQLTIRHLTRNALALYTFKMREDLCLRPMEFPLLRKFCAICKFASRVRLVLKYFGFTIFFAKLQRAKLGD